MSSSVVPGWAAMTPLRNLLAEHAQVMTAPGQGIVSRVDASLDFAEKVIKSGALYGRVNPQVVTRLGQLKEQNRQYLAHEYFNSHWMPMSFSDVHAWLEDAKLSFASSANYLDHVDVLNLTPEQQQLLSELPDPTFRQTVRDFMVNSQFRKDYWVRGARQLSMVERVEALRGLRFAMVMPRDQVKLKIKGVLGEANMSEAIYRPVLDCFNGYRVLSFVQLEEAVRPAGVQLDALMQALTILICQSVLQPAQHEEAVETALPATRRLNRKLCEQARYTDTVMAMASPVIGGAINLNRVDKLLLLGEANGAKDAEALARSLIGNLALGGARILKDGKPLDTPEAELGEALQLTNGFKERILPLLKSLRIEC